MVVRSRERELTAQPEVERPFKALLTWLTGSMGELSSLALLLATR
jgi:hypothetical protein